MGGGGMSFFSPPEIIESHKITELQELKGSSGD